MEWFWFELSIQKFTEDRDTVRRICGKVGQALQQTCIIAGFQSALWMETLDAGNDPYVEVEEKGKGLSMTLTMRNMLDSRR